MTYTMCSRRKMTSTISRSNSTTSTVSNVTAAAMGMSMGHSEEGRRMSLADDVAALEAEHEELKRELAETRDELEGYQMALGDDEYLKTEIATFRGFIADVRHGIRDLSEYEEVCHRGYWVT